MTENFAMGKLHKDIAVMMMQLAEGEATDQDIVKVMFKIWHSFLIIV